MVYTAVAMKWPRWYYYIDPPPPPPTPRTILRDNKNSRGYSLYELLFILNFNKVHLSNLLYIQATDRSQSYIS